MNRATMNNSGKVLDCAAAALTLALASVLTGCIGIGYTSGGGWFVWPGGLGLVLLILLVLLVLRRR